MLCALMKSVDAVGNRMGSENEIKTTAKSFFSVVVVVLFCFIERIDLVELTELVCYSALIAQHRSE